MPVTAKHTALDASLPIGAQLHHVLRARVIRGDLTPGMRLSEAGIAAEFEVSRQPVREVFIKLAEEGLLEIRPQRGTVVPRISLGLAEEARFVREAIEADVVRIAAARMSGPEVDALDAILEDQRRAADTRSVIDLDDRFHRAIAAGAGRSYAWRVIEGLKVPLDRVRYLSLLQVPRAGLIDEHAAVVAAIRAGDPDAAEAAMRRHLNAIVADLPTIAGQNPEFFGEARPAEQGAT